MMVQDRVRDAWALVHANDQQRAVAALFDHLGDVEAPTPEDAQEAACMVERTYDGGLKGFLTDCELI